MSNNQNDKPKVIPRRIPDNVRQDQGSKALFRQAQAAEAAKPASPAPHQPAKK